MSHDCGIKVDLEGNWFYEGRPIIRKEIIEIFYQSLEYDPQKREFWINWQGNRCRLEVEDTPYIVTRVDKIQEDTQEKILISLKHLNKQETLDPTTLRINKDNVLYCFVENNSIPARFSRPAYYQLAEWIEQDERGFFINLNGRKYYIREV